MALPEGSRKIKRASCEGSSSESFRLNGRRSRNGASNAMDPIRSDHSFVDNRAGLRDARSTEPCRVGLWGRSRNKRQIGILNCNGLFGEKKKSHVSLMVHRGELGFSLVQDAISRRCSNVSHMQR